MAKSIIVTIESENRKGSQKWKFDIDKPGPAKKETRKARYCSPSNARRAAAGILGGWFNRFDLKWWCNHKGKRTAIKFVMK